MVQARYQYAIDVMLTRLRMIDADLTEKNERPLIRNLCSRIKTAESIVKKLERKEREVTFETAVNTLNDIAGVRVVCYFADDIYQIADAVRRQKDFTIVKEKNYIRKPKKSDEGICRCDRRCGSEDAGASQEDTENVRVSGNPKRQTYIK